MPSQTDSHAKGCLMFLGALPIIGIATMLVIIGIAIARAIF